MNNQEDIVARLRKRMTSHDLHYLPDAMSQEAADEIELLRSALSQADEHGNFSDMYDREHEMEKLILADAFDRHG